MYTIMFTLVGLKNVYNNVYISSGVEIYTIMYTLVGVVQCIQLCIH